MGKIIWVLGLSIASGIAYRIGGKGGFKGAKLIRRVLCPLLALGLFFTLRTPQIRHIWLYLATFILSYGAMSTYHDYIGYDCWILTGLFYGLSAFPLIWVGVYWFTIILRATVLAITIVWLRERTGKVFKEEFGSGFLYCATMLLLLI